MATATDRVQLLKEAGCPYNLKRSPGYYLRQVNTYLDRIGQLDGYWSPEGEVLIPQLFPESATAEAISEQINAFRDTEKYAVRVHKDLLNGPLQHEAWMLFFGAAYQAVDIANGWSLFCIVGNEQTYWLLSGMLFPEYDGSTEGWIVFLPASEVLG